MPRVIDESRTELNEAEILILAEKMRNPGHGPTKIAAALGMSRTTVSILCNTEPLRSHIEEFFREVIESAKEALMGGASDAAAELHRQIRGMRLSVLGAEERDPDSSPHLRQLAAVRLLSILRGEKEKGDLPTVDEWEYSITATGQVKAQQVKQIPQGTPTDGDYEM